MKEKKKQKTWSKCVLTAYKSCQENCMEREKKSTQE